MRKELQDKLCKKYPKIFEEVGKSPQESCMAWGLDCGDGWYWLIDNLCENLQFNTDKNDEPQVVASQVKEKFGGLRFYVNGASDRQYSYISFAESLSFKICEQCGSFEGVTTEGPGWIKSLCQECKIKDV